MAAGELSEEEEKRGNISIWRRLRRHCRPRFGTVAQQHGCVSKSCELLTYLARHHFWGFVDVKRFGNVTQNEVSCLCRQHFLSTIGAFRTNFMPINAVKVG